jgi:hypothetical protein
MTTTTHGPNVLGLYLESLNDVVLTPPLINTDVLTWDSSEGMWTNVAPGSGGLGTVTSIAAGTGLSASPSSPITTAGTLSITNTAVTPGSYTDASITVNQQGQITAASNGTSISGVDTTLLNGTSSYTTIWTGNGTSATPLGLITPWDHIAYGFVTNNTGSQITLLTVPVLGIITVVEYYVEARDSIMTNYGFFRNTAVYNGSSNPAVREGAGTQVALPSGTTISVTDSASTTNVIIQGTGVSSSNITWRVWVRVFAF